MSSSNRPTTYVVDVCGTLVRDDTTLGLLRIHFSRNYKRPLRSHVLRFLTAQVSPARWAFMILERLSGRHLLKHLLVRMLAGDRASDLDASGQVYAQELLDSRRVDPVWERIERASKPGELLLASASLEPVVKALAQRMGARYVSSTLEVSGDLLTGRYAEDLTGTKEAAILRKYGSDALAQPFAAFSDNFSDRSLLSKATYACVVLHREAHRARWGDLSAEFVQVKT